MKQIGCRICRQNEDVGNMIISKDYDAGWLGTVQASAMLENFPEVMNSKYEYHDNDKACLYFELWKKSKETIDEPFVAEAFEIKFCPFCGANLKKVRDFMRTQIKEEDEE